LFVTNLPSSAARKQTGAGTASLPAGGPFFLSYTKPAALHWRGGWAQPAVAAKRPLRAWEESV